MADDNVIFIRPDDKIFNFLKKFWVYVLLVILALYLGSSMLYVVEPQEQAVILRFGQYNRVTEPGLHLKLPNLKPFLTIEEVMKAPVKNIQKIEMGFRTKSAGVKTYYDDSNQYKTESVMLTGDLNVVDMQWVVQYWISDIRDYLFNVNNVRNNIVDLTQAVMREVVGDRTATEVLTIGKTEIEAKVKEEMQKIIDRYKMGIQISTVKLQDVNPPEVVKPSFNEVNTAKQEAEQMVNDAWKDYNKIIPAARGKADETIAKAKAYKVNLVNRAKGDAKRFMSFYEEYKKAPAITKNRLYYEKLQDVLKNAKELFIIDNDVKGVVPFLSLKNGETK